MWPLQARLLTIAVLNKLKDIRNNRYLRGVWSVAILLLSSFFASAQQDSLPLLIVENDTVTKAHFLLRYQQQGGDASPQAFADAWVELLLKSQAARRAGLDTLAAHQRVMIVHRNEWRRGVLADSAEAEKRARWLYKRMAARTLSDSLRVQQIFFSMPQNMLKAEVKACEVRMDSLHQALQQGASFEALAHQFSEQPEPFWVTGLTHTQEMEEVLQDMQSGACSTPFITPLGIHLIRLIERKPLPPYEQLRASLMANAQVGFKRDVHAPVSEQLVASGYEQAMQWQEIQILAREAQEQLLPSSPTPQQLDSFFVAHQQAYQWEAPRFHGAVIQARSKRLLKQVRKLIKELPEAEWNEAVRLLFNKEDEQVRFHCGVFAQGDNPFVDEKIFKQNDAEVDAGFPHWRLHGKRKKGPDNAGMVGEKLLADYKKAEEMAWLNRLRDIFKVEINQEVLKTVNNHGYE